jgi:hypothetical protein
MSTHSRASKVSAVETLLSNGIANKHLCTVVYKRPMSATFHDTIFCIEDTQFIVDTDHHVQFLDYDDPLYDKEQTISIKDYKKRPICFRKQVSNVEKNELSLLWVLVPDR